MAITIRDLNFTSAAPTVEKYPVDGAADTVLTGRLVGIYKTGNAKEGQVLEYDDTVADLVPHGIASSDAAADAEDSAIYVDVETSGLTCLRATVTGSGSSAPGDKVYATNDDIAGTTVAFTMTQPTAGVLPFAVLKEQSSSGATTWRVQLLPSAYLGAQKSGVYLPGPLVEYTADGAIALPTIDNTCVELIGASSASMTLVDPTAAQLGFTLHVVRIGGTGTHDLDVADTGGTTRTYVLGAAGDSLTLYAFSLDGWRLL